MKGEKLTLGEENEWINFETQFAAQEVLSNR